MSIDDIIDEIAYMTVQELVTLTNQLSARLGIKMVPSINQVWGPGGGEPPTILTEKIEEPTAFDVILHDVQVESRTKVMLALRKDAGRSLSEVKNILENMPRPVAFAVPKLQANALAGLLKANGATATVEPAAVYMA